MEGEYYNPPIPWNYETIVQRYTDNISKCDWHRPVSFEALQSYSEIVRVKRALQLISEAIKENDPAAIELSIDFVLSPVYFHYSGYIRESMARRLRSCNLGEKQRKKLVSGIESLIKNSKKSYEFPEIKRLYKKAKES